MFESLKVKLRLWLILLLTLATWPVWAEVYGNVTVEMLPSIYDSMGLNNTYGRHFLFRVSNAGSKDAKLDFAINGGVSSRRSIVVPPGERQILDMYLPESQKYYYNARLELLLNGSTVATPFFNYGSGYGKKSVFLISQNYTDVQIRNIYSSSYNDYHIETPSTPVSEWPNRSSHYKPFNAVFISERDYENDSLRKAMDEMVFDGGDLIIEYRSPNPSFEQMQKLSNNLYVEHHGLGRRFHKVFDGSNNVSNASEKNLKYKYNGVAETVSYTNGDGSSEIISELIDNNAVRKFHSLKNLKLPEVN